MDEPISQKKGWKTTEFWVTISSLLVTLLTGAGVITLSEGSQITTIVSQLVSALIAGVTTGYYIKRRSDLKEEHIVQIANNPDLCSGCGKTLSSNEKHGHDVDE